MPNIGKVLKDEISRLARKEIRSSTATMHKDVIRLKKTVAEQKRRLASLERENRRLAGIADTMRQEMVKPEEDEVERARVTGKMVKRVRSRLGLSQAEFGLLAGVTAASVCKWERTEGTLTLYGASKARIVELRRLTKPEARDRLASAAQPKAAKKKRRTKSRKR